VWLTASISWNVRASVQPRLLLVQVESLGGAIGDVLGDGQRGRRGGRWRVADVHHVRVAVNDEVVDQLSVWRERLGANPRGSRQQVVLGQLRHVALERRQEGRLAEVAVDLLQTGPPVLRGQGLEAAVAERV